MSARELAGAALLALGCTDLAGAWRGDPHLRAGPFAFAVWLFAVAVARRDAEAGEAQYTARWQLLAVGLAVAGRVLELHALSHAALAAWMAAGCARPWLVALAAASWMPAGHVLMPLYGTAFVRLALAAAPLLLAREIVRVRRIS